MFKEIFEFLEENKSKAPSIFYVDFFYPENKNTYRNLGFYYTLEEAVGSAKVKLAKQFGIKPELLVYQTNLRLDSDRFFHKLIDVYFKTEEEKSVNQKMRDLIKKGDLDLVEESEIPDFQKQYVIDTINKLKNKNEKR